MFKKWLGFVLGLYMFIAYTPAYAASVTAESLFSQMQMIEGMLDRGSPPEELKAQVDHAAGMLTKLDLSKTSMTLSGLNSLSSEMLGLQMRLQSIHLPQQTEVKEQVQRLKVAFESLAYPKTAKWKQTTKEMEQITDRLLASLTTADSNALQKELQSLLASQNQVKIAMDLNLSPEQVNLLLSASRFIEQQAGQMTDAGGMKDALLMYKKTLQEINQVPPAASAGTKQTATSYNPQSWWIAAALVASCGYLIYRRVKTH